MSILQSHVVVAAKPGQWDEARRIARLVVEDAHSREGTLAYEIYEDVDQHRLINIAAYRDAVAWAAHIGSNPYAQTYMTLCDLVSLNIHGNPPADLRAKIESYGAARIYHSIP